MLREIIGYTSCDSEGNAILMAFDGISGGDQLHGRHCDSIVFNQRHFVAANAENRYGNGQEEPFDGERQSDDFVLALPALAALH